MRCRTRSIIDPLALLLLLLCTPGSCAPFPTVPVRPPMALVYTHVKAPLTTDLSGQSVEASGKRVSQSSTWFFQILDPTLSFAGDDAAIMKIAKDGGLEEVWYAEYELLRILGLYQKFTVHVYGQ